MGSYDDHGRVDDRGLASGSGDPTIVATVLASGPYANTATIDGDQFDPTRTTMRTLLLLL